MAVDRLCPNPNEQPVTRGGKTVVVTGEPKETSGDYRSCAALELFSSRYDLKGPIPCQICRRNADDFWADEA